MSKCYDIAQLGNPVLRQIAAPVVDFADQAMIELAAALEAQMLASEGVGIAAPQLGQSWQMLIVASRPTRRYPNAPVMAPTLMLNPRFQVLNATCVKDWEGCLSVPGVRALVPRWLAITVQFQNGQGEMRELTLEGFAARVFQHEFDHLQGLVYLDRVENNQDIIAESEFFKLLQADFK